MASGILSHFTLRHAALIVLAIVYGLCGSPTPQGFGWAEIVVGLCLVMAISPGRALQSLIKKPDASWLVAGQALLLYGLTIPLIGGVIAGHDPGLMLRDVIPFLFLLLPLFMADWRDDPVGSKKAMIAAVVFIGVAFGARVFAGGPGYDPLYLSIAPTVVFAAIFLAGLAGQILFRAINLKSIILAGGLIALALLPFAAMIMTVQRASLTLSVLALGLLFILACWRNPVRAAGPALLIVAMALLFGSVAGAVYDSLLQKQGLVGTNMRLQEALAVFDAIGNSIWQVFFGNGWGATIASPAVGGVTVNYTHSLLTSYWLKTGLVGVFLLILYLYGVCAPLVRLRGKNPLLAVALAVPVVIDAILYASFKSLDFGLILLLIAMWAGPRARLRGTSA
ncbi:MAG: hypothetical protein ACXW30_07130 [Micavibrio sp.]